MPSSSTRTLFDISSDLISLYEQMEALGGDITDPEIEQTFDRWFSDLGQERDDKLDHYAALIREMEARAAARREESRRLAERAKVDEERADYLKHRLMLFFQEHELKTIETRRYRLTLQRSGGKPPVILNIDPEDLPEAFQRVKISANLEQIREALEQGETLDFASLGERGMNIRIS